MKGKNYTIKDIAKLAGVSKGTVDRVLHNRGKVSQKSLDAINEVLAKIDYRPNILARSLKNSKNYIIYALIPNPEEDPYWSACMQGIEESLKEFESFGIDIRVSFFNPISSDSFKTKSKTIIKTHPDAILIPSLFHKQSLQIIEECRSKNILVSIFNDQINSDHVKCYVGQDLYKSGKVAARLMESITPKNARLFIIHLDEAYNNAIHMQKKEKGFRDYFDEIEKGNYHITTLSSKQENLNSVILNYINSESQIDGIFVTTSKSFAVAQSLSSLPTEQNIKIIGYDLLKENIECLVDKKIDYLIYQAPKQQTYLSIVYLAEYLLFKKTIPREKQLPIHIINSENFETHL